ncbi:glycoside hydrolase family 25 protein [Bombiscardovia coagulans]|uniref:Glycosyl hydrolase family 25 n=1 Tax=Bombiscardovia coagulans TaxID=686666 RepID=A0A261EPZ7_9BIFI|nr:glycoside hydrolase family 25 protein [Bombiscardovia coagulans]OZG48928.1 glycosyl hydrolase family 25 [Bombiscardovia coagulans]
MILFSKVCALLASAGLAAMPMATSLTVSNKSHPSFAEANTVLSVADQSVDHKAQAEQLPQSVSPQVSSEAVLVSPQLAVESSGQIKDVETGALITDPAIVGTAAKPADPLAKTHGESFEPLPIDEVERQVDSTQHTSQPSVRPASLQLSNRPYTYTAGLPNNEYGAHWGRHNGSQAFFQSNGQLFVQQAHAVVDVSQWQKTINWEVAKASGVEGAIIRIGYGWGNGFDTQALRNINECKRLGIPFGIYLYSYSYDAATAAMEGDSLVDLLRRAGVSPSNLSYPVYYDLEPWAWTGHSHPTNPAVYDSIVNAWYGRLRAAGYNNLSVYSYPYYLNTALNAPSIHAKTDWVASYGPTPLFNFPRNERCWQYSSTGLVAGINGHVDLNACGVATVAATNEMPIYRVYNPNSGEHFLTSNPVEYRQLSGKGWNAEGVAWVAPADGAPVYRLYSLNQGRHLYTMNGNEYNMLTQYRWRQEGLNWRSGGAVPVYRVYNPNSGQHLFTVNANERNHLVSLGWCNEGTAWYGVRY